MSLWRKQRQTMDVHINSERCSWDHCGS